MAKEGLKKILDQTTLEDETKEKVKKHVTYIVEQLQPALLASPDRKTPDYKAAPDNSLTTWKEFLRCELHGRGLLVWRRLCGMYGNRLE